MSIHGIIEAMRSDYPPATRLVWQSLENHANGDRWWQTTNQALATELHLSKNTVDRATDELEKDQIIRREFYRRRRTIFHMLRIYPAGLSHQKADQTPDLDHQNDDSTAPFAWDLDPQKCDPTPDLSHQNVALTPELSHKKGDSCTQQKESTSKTPPAKRARTREAVVAVPDAQQIVDAWNAMAKQTGLAPIRTVSEARRKHLTARLRDHGVAGIIEAIDAIGASAFCHGHNKTGWKATFSSLLQDKTCCNAREGVYADRGIRPLDPNLATGFAATMVRDRIKRAQPSDETTLEVRHG